MEFAQEFSVTLNPSKFQFINYDVNYNDILKFKGRYAKIKS